MNIKPRTRREFMGQVGQGTLAATLGGGLAQELGLAPAMAEEAPKALNFGSLEPLVCLMQETPANKLLPKLAEAMRSGTDLRTLVTAAALANSRTCGGEDYEGFHVMMAIAPSYYMAQQMPEGQQALPVFKVLYRNTDCIQGCGGRAHETLHAVPPLALPAGKTGGEALRDAGRRKDMAAAEGLFASLAAGSPEETFSQLLWEVQDDTEVHRVVLPYRAWDLLGVIGKEHAHTLLRNSLRYCLNAEGRWTNKDARVVLPKVLEEHHLLDRAPGTRTADDYWMDRFSMDLISSTPTDAAHAVGAALAEGMSPDDIGECLTLAANQLMLRDAGRPPEEESQEKLVGSVHGNSVGVHSCDAANAWRNMARMSNPRNAYACLILGAFQVAWDRVGGSMSHYTTDFLHRSPLPSIDQLRALKATDPKGLLKIADGAIQHNLQAHACAAMARYGELGHDPRAAFDLMLRYAVSEDGALHGEKFFQTSFEEFNHTRPAFRWRYLIALARVTASEYGHAAKGIAEARQILKV